ncbi:unnamed protein product, partial [Amoebophrya sp. A25]
ANSVIRDPHGHDPKTHPATCLSLLLAQFTSFFCLQSNEKMKPICIRSKAPLLLLWSLAACALSLMLIVGRGSTANLQGEHDVALDREEGRSNIFLDHDWGLSEEAQGKLDSYVEWYHAAERRDEADVLGVRVSNIGLGDAIEGVIKQALWWCLHVYTDDTTSESRKSTTGMAKKRESEGGSSGKATTTKKVRDRSNAEKKLRGGEGRESCKKTHSTTDATCAKQQG